MPIWKKSLPLFGFNRYNREETFVRRLRLSELSLNRLCLNHNIINPSWLADLPVPYFHPIMLQDPQTIRFYQRLTDAMVSLWERGYRFDEIRLYMDGYLASLRHSNVLEPYLVHRLEEAAFNFLQDPLNFTTGIPQPEPEMN